MIDSVFRAESDQLQSEVISRAVKIKYWIAVDQLNFVPPVYCRKQDPARKKSIDHVIKKCHNASVDG